MFRPINYFILQILTQIIKVIAVTCHTDYQITVPFRMSLGVFQSFCIYYVELYMMTVKTEIASDQ